jgi:hypothetical protein
MCASQDAQMCFCTTADGTVSILSVDRRTLLNEGRVLISRPSFGTLPVHHNHKKDDNSISHNSNAKFPVIPRSLYMSDIEHELCIIAAGNEWSILKLNDLICWLEENPVESDCHM